MKQSKKLSHLSLTIFSSFLSLVGCSSSDDNQVILYMSSEEERIEYISNGLKAQFPKYNIVTQYTDTGTLITKLKGEGTNTQCDIFFDLEGANAEMILQSNPGLFADLSYLDKSIYDSSVLNPNADGFTYAPDIKTDCCLVVNKSVLEQNNLEIPTSYDDLLDPKYKDLIVMPNPKTSGTGYSFYNGLVSLKGEEEALSYFSNFSKNVKEFTTSGSAPIKALQRNEAAIGVCIMFQAVEFSNSNPNLQPVYPSEGCGYNIFNMGMITGHEKKTAVKEVFDYLYNTLNPDMLPHFNAEKTYKDQNKTSVENWSDGFTEIKMNGLWDPDYKQNLLDKWTF